MEKRYQVFVSSTYADLKEERQRVIQTLMELDCIPAGMELFPAADQDQFEFIKRVIDDCDYYLLIIGGRYGSLSANGVSYTEQEFDYAVAKGMRVIALLHEKPDDIPVGKSELDPNLRDRLRAFRDRAATARLVKFWNTADQLPGIVALSLSKTIKMYPAVGWVRADKTSSEELLSEINELRKTNSELQRSLSQVSVVPQIALPDIAGLDENFLVHGNLVLEGRRYRWHVELSWKEIFGYVAPYLIKIPHESVVKGVIEKAAHEKAGKAGLLPDMDDQDFQTISIQLKALGLVKLDNLKTIKGGTGVFWSATPKGEALTLQLRVIRTRQASENRADDV
ncbi:MULTISPECIES: DUF4062 domain-containing protein [Burkholderiales]|uniref:DUF4062 domain-containing protein n=1 Tax=Burkholderiales TaxID=80840 RepID=UPI0029D5E92E|nr:DUF4062 domain-containing protein [Achromobacter sp.]MCG2601859.1 DUF4062 domain-containing protein [Achromobacter sp.]